MKQKIKQMLVKRSVKKRKKQNTFDDVKSEHFELPDDAGLDQNNSYYFSAHNETSSFFIRLGRRGGGTTELWFAYYNKSGVAYVNPKIVFSDEDCPLTLNVVEPLKKWNIKFKGKLKKAKQNEGSLLLEPFGENLDAIFNGVFTSNDKLYEFSRDSDAGNFASAVAKEKWSKEFFAALSENTQIHAEQGGFLKGDLIVEGNLFNISSPAMRDHSFGKRDWNYMDRHIWLMAVSDEEHLNANMVRYPALKGLKTGYHLKSGKHTNVTKAEDLASITNQGYKEKFKYSLKLEDGRVLNNECTLNAVFKFEMGGSYTIYECVSDFLIDNGRVLARGIAEFGYNLDEQRWK